MITLREGQVPRCNDPGDQTAQQCTDRRALQSLIRSWCWVSGGFQRNVGCGVVACDSTLRCHGCPLLVESFAVKVG